MKECPTCGESWAEHTEREKDRCAEGYAMDSLLISRAIDGHLSRAGTTGKEPEPLNAAPAAERQEPSPEAAFSPFGRRPFHPISEADLEYFRGGEPKALVITIPGIVIEEGPELPTTCCKNVGGADLRFCDKPASHWYLHNGDVCSYCEEHDYVCGDRIEPKG